MLVQAIKSPFVHGNYLNFKFVNLGFSFLVRLLGPLFVITFYNFLALHLYAYFTVVLYVIKKRLGTTFGLIWIGIGIALVYNIFYNHLLASCIKPGGPSDLRVITIMVIRII